ncbi:MULTISPECIES: hypothetical protein [Bacteroides]|jgi:hypothetical protein|uniref:hypothetical protein n=1 Tax=Bacteroides TaxID=816 RepID=UPI000AA6C77C|nr:MULTISPECIES: hypothetical protein [Bacteroides]MCM0195952.1 hypothetical protein [Bacteroides fragilis]MCM0199752.1 hypothetical protein [Bacteroides fragilis]MCM0211347.1 hypothetical protein [Bacteroides fragilis]MCM0214611.1 hypothetical protein [Bacteroides fragilis]MCM0226942.1 hypothetical protein [Bacteroides fragilis]
MKKSSFIFAALLAVLFMSISTVNAQNLLTLPKVERDSKIIEIAKAAYKKKKFTNFYREYGTPRILEMKTRELPGRDGKPISQDKNSIWYGSKPGDTFYIVEFPYDLNKERFDQNYAAQVYVWANPGRAFAIALGNTFRLPIKNDGSEDIFDESTRPRTCSISYSKDVPKNGLVYSAKENEIITLELRDLRMVADDGMKNEEYYVINNIENGQLISDTKPTISTRRLQIIVLGDMHVDLSYVHEEFEDPY